MKRKMVWIGIPWLLGLFLAVSCQLSVVMCLLPAAWMLLGAFRLFRQIPAKEALCAGGAMGLAVGAVLLYTALVCQPVMEYDGKITTFSGSVTQVTEYDGDRAQYQVKGAFADGTRAKVLVYTDDLGAQYGDTLQIAGPFSVPEDSYLWNEASYYRSKGIFLQADSDASVRLTPTDHGKLVRWLHAYRERISLRIRMFAGTEAGGLVSAMLLGTRSTLPDETKNLFAHHGISHVVSVSGLHLVLFLSVWQWIGRRLHLRRWPQFCSTALWTAAYALMVDTPVSILRAGLMFLLVQSAPLVYRRADTLNSLCIAGVVLTLGNPYLMGDASFLLSMAGTFGIGVFAPWMTAKISSTHFGTKLLQNLVSLCCVSLAIFPVTLLYFREISVISPIANLLLVPICTGMLLIAVIVFLTGGIGLVLKPAAVLLRLMYRILLLFSYGLQRLVPAMFPTGWKLLPLLVCLLIGFAVLVAFLKKRQRTTAVALAISIVLLYAGQTAYQMGERSVFRVTVLGQKKDAVVVIAYQGRTDVIDLTGGYRNPKYVKAWLQSEGIRTLSTLCLTKNVDQMRVCYPQTMPLVSAEEAAVPSDCWLPEPVFLMGAEIYQTDLVQITDPLYTVTLADDVLQIQFGNLRFCVGTTLEKLPDGEWNAVICNRWNGGEDTAFPEQTKLVLRRQPAPEDILPPETYVQEEAVQLRVTASGEVTVTVPE